VIRSLLAHPLTRGLDVDDPRTTVVRRRIIQEKPFLRRLYQEWYAALVSRLPDGSAPILELGSGAGFLADLIPGLITSEVFSVPDISVVLDARRLPFPAGSLRAIVMTDVLHHIPDPAAFLAESTRTLTPHGRILMIEPWVTPWSRVVYTYLHSEPFDPKAAQWGFPASGPLSGANGAMPWIMFARDRAAFETLFPQLTIRELTLMMPISYLVSGGVSMRGLSPGWSYSLWRTFERVIAPLNGLLAMFAVIDIEHTPGAAAK
jgi:SAM-dependent methyltransferase